MHRILPMTGAMLLVLVFGYILGRIATVRFVVASVPELAVTADPRPGVAVIGIHGIRDGLLRGDLQGEVRLFLAGEQIIPSSSGSFAVDPGPLLTDDVTVQVPEGMRYVASKRGTRYYPVVSRQGEQIVPGNRVYFRTPAEAEAAGYAATD